MGKSVGTEVGGSTAKRYGKRVYKGVFKKRYTVADMALKAWNGIKYMRTLINSERKMHTNDQSSVAIDYNGTLFHLSAIAQGDTTNTREGRSILMNYVSFRGNCARIEADSILRLITFIDTQGNGIAPSVNNVLQTVGSTLAPFAPLDTSYAGRFKILSSDLISLNSQNPNVLFKKYLKRLHHIKWQTAADGGGIMKGHVYLLAVSDRAPAAADRPNMQFVSRLAFRDN